MHFESPWTFLVLALIPLLFWIRLHRRQGGGIRFSTTGNAARAGRSLRQRLSFIPPALRVMALGLLIIALARPQTGRARIREISHGIAIEMVVDRSGSMGAEMEYQGKRRNRLEVVKRVFQDFIMGGNGLKGRPNDLVGMIAFAGYPDTLCPLTLAHGALPRFLDRLKLVQRRSEDGTAIGDALALAAARLKTAEKTLALQRRKDVKGYEIKSKIIILLTDGENNAGRRRPLQAAELASKWGIKVYTIGVGGGEAVTTIQTPFGNYKVPMGAGMDEGALRAIAAKSGGLYRSADSEESLRSIYREIDKMEKSEIESLRTMDYKEAFMPFALGALILIFLESILSSTVFRKIP